MKTYCKHADPSDPRQIEKYIWACLDPKRKRRDYSSFIARYCHQQPKDIRADARAGYGLTDAMKEAVRNIALDIADRIRSGDLRLEEIVYQDRRDGMSKKIRRIGLMSVMQQVMEHVAVGCMEELWAAKYEVHQYASIQGRGQLQGARTIVKWTKSGKTKYFVKLDVRKCFASMKREVCMKWLRRDIGKNRTLLWFADALLQMHSDGLVIGSLLSQFLCNYFMSYAYRYVMNLHKTRRGRPVKMVACTLFYMDDILLTGTDRRNIVSAVRKLTRYTHDSFGIEIKGGWHVRLHRDAGIDMMGYVIRANGRIAIRKRIFIRARRAFVKMAAGDTRLITAYRVSAYYGYFKAAKIRSFRTHDRRLVNTHSMKFQASEIVSIYAKEAIPCAA